MIAFLQILSTFSCLILSPPDTLRIISVPLDHREPRGKQITISFTHFQPYQDQKETILLLDDPLDNYFQQSMDLRDLADEFNLVQIKGRHQSEVLLTTIHSSGQTDWSKAYQLLNVDQHARDLEKVRKALPGDRPVHLVGFSGAAAYLHYYLSRFPEKVSSLISFNPLLFDLQKNLNFRYPAPCPEAQANRFWFAYLWHAHAESLCPDTGGDGDDFPFYAFLQWGFLVPGLWENREEDVALKVRLFEHSYDLLANSPSEQPPSIAAAWMKQESQPIWKELEQASFSVHGVDYDKGRLYEGKVLIVGAVHDKLLSRYCYDVLAEFYPQSSLMLLRDGHALGKLRATGLQRELIRSFLLEDNQEKIGVYQSLREAGLLYDKRDRYNL
ncbi:alpha/beta hydrolase [Cyclobacterium plantarum]|uniref:alpha/beta hydrolase n=1 Tax=Cyclobacterium plantarum TaxID=2716263 RepID=UPI003F710E54